MKLLSCAHMGILGTWYLSLGVLRHVFKVKFAVSILVIFDTLKFERHFLFGCWGTYIS